MKKKPLEERLLGKRPQEMLLKKVEQQRVTKASMLLRGRSLARLPQKKRILKNYRRS